MPEFTLPHRLVKASATVSRWLLWPMVVFWLVLLIVWGGLHGWIVPRISDWRPLLEQEASRVLGVPVRIGALTARSQGLLPTFEMRDVSLLDAQGRAALRLPLVIGSVSPGSLWNLGFEQLFIDQPELDIRRTAQGKWLIAGLDFTRSAQSDGNEAADWLFSQTEFFIRKGSVRWTDERRSTAPLTLEAVDLLLRNRSRRHALRIDATPPASWGQRFSVQAQFRQPLLSTRHSRWQDWDGQVFAHFAQVDVSQLRQYADLGDLGIDLRQGRGALRLWGDVSQGQLVGATADAALFRVDVRLASDLAALELEQVLGRVSARALAGGFEFSTQGLQFQTSDGLHWPGGNVFVSYTQGEGRLAAQGEFRADHLDLAALSQIANRVPLGLAVHRALGTYKPKGLVEHVQARWQGRPNAIEKYSAQGRVVGLDIAANADDSGKLPLPSSPGVRGLSADFMLSEGGGKAQLSVQHGALEFPGVFDDPAITVDQLSADAQWQVTGEQLALQLSNTKFANADAQGELTAQWRSADPSKSSARSRFPGVLDLQGSLSRADGARVYRYLPKSLPIDTRNYVRLAVLQGQATSAKFRVKGDLNDMPFTDPKLGEFRIAAQLRNVTLAYVPKSLQGKDEVPWPTLTQLTGELVFERNHMLVNNLSSTMQHSPTLLLSNAQAQIPDLQASVLSVSTDLRGSVPDVLRFVTNSPVSEMLGHGLDRATGSGSVDAKLRLSIPLQTPEKTKLQGTIVLGGNELHFTPDSPVLTRARGSVQFSESGFALQGVQARLLGGDARIEGGMKSVANPTVTDSTLSLRAQGSISADGLRNARELGFWSRLGKNASGSTSYSANLGMRQGVLELSVSSSLQGLATGLPAPLDKNAETALPLRFDIALAPDQGKLMDRVSAEIGKVASVSYVRDVSGKDARVLRGSIAVGLQSGEAVSSPTDGVAANLHLNSVDLNAWSNALDNAASSPVTTPMAPAAASADPSLAYLPTTLAVRANELRYGSLQFNHVVAGGSREGLTWRANLHTDEGSGYVEWGQPSGAHAGRVFARLAQLRISPSTASQMENLLDEQPRSIPALDIVVEEFELRGKKLGRVEVDAINRGALARDGGTREWRLNKFNVSNPEASLIASGNWATLSNPAQPERSSTRATERRRTVLNFKLGVHDAGGLLARLGMKDVVRRGNGKLEGQVSWMGSPLSPDYPSLGGQFNLEVETGQFLQVEPGAAKLLGVLSLQSLPRRLTLDFRDVFSSGFAFDFVRGDVQIANGLARTNNLQMKGVNAAVLMEGQADIVRETQNLRVVVVPEINAGTASLVAGIINPAIGLGSFLAQMFLRRPLIEANTQEFHIDGTWTDYKVTKVPHLSVAPPVGTPASAPSATTQP